ncbi:MAG: hypothetical protein ACKERG_03410 [Candidatus Hodgkinia cicadicola]
MLKAELQKGEQPGGGTAAAKWIATSGWRWLAATPSAHRSASWRDYAACANSFWFEVVNPKDWPQKVAASTGAEKSSLST